MSGSVQKIRSLPSNIARLFHTYNWQAVDPTPSILFDTDGDWVNVLLPLAEDAIRLLEQNIPDEGMRTLEVREAKKASVNWRNVGKGRLRATDLAGHRSDPDQAALLRPGLKTLGKQIASVILAAGAHLREKIDDAPVILNSQKGLPWCIPGSDEMAAYAIGRVWFTPDIKWRKAETVESEVVNEMTPDAQLVLRRIQGAADEVTAFEPDGNGDLLIERPHRGPKARSLKATPTWRQIPTIEVAEVLKWALRQASPAIEGVPADLAAERGFWQPSNYQIPTDFSTYDDTMASETRTDVRELVLAPALDAMVTAGLIGTDQRQNVLDMDWWNANAPLLYPTIYHDCVADLAAVKGRLRSGERLTSWIGSVVNIALNRTICSIAKLPFNALVLSDDFVIGFASKEEASRYEETYNSVKHGFTVKFGGYPVFLQRYMNGSAIWGRAIDFNREPMNDFVSSLDLMLTIRIRQQLLKNHPLGQEYIPFLKRHERVWKHVQALESWSVAELMAAVTYQSLRNGGRRSGPFAGEDIETIRAKFPMLESLSDEDLAALTSRRNIRFQDFMTESLRLFPSTEAAHEYLQSRTAMQTSRASLDYHEERLVQTKRGFQSRGLTITEISNAGNNQWRS